PAWSGGPYPEAQPLKTRPQWRTRIRQRVARDSLQASLPRLATNSGGRMKGHS
ncbi:hypothetical protein THAOC_31705, partial [Thalassiosira oceanica]